MVGVCCGRAELCSLINRLIRPFATKIAGWIIATDPDFTLAVVRHRTSHLARATPDKLSIVAAISVAGIAAIGVILRFGCPFRDYR